MSKTAPTFGTESSLWEPKLPFDLVVAYEDTHTRNRALVFPAFRLPQFFLEGVFEDGHLDRGQ